MLGLIEGDDLAHVIAVRHARSNAHWRVRPPQVTNCGQPVTIELAHGYEPAPGDGCHVCLPGLAHPLAAVWATCRRWDANANAGIGA